MYDNFQYRRKSTGEILRDVFLGKNVLSRLILINTIIFLLANIASLGTWLFTGNIPQLSPLGSIMALPSSLAGIALKPWTIFTYMFLHEAFFHWFFNMLVLYFAGLLFMEYLSQRKLLITYIIGGLVGAAFFVLAFNIFPAFAAIKSISIALGASASILAILIAISTYVPDYNVHLFLIGRVKLKYMAIALVILDILSIQSANPGGHIAHIGGAVWGFIYGYSLRKGTDIYRIFDNWKLPQLSFKHRKYQKFSTSRPESGRPMTDEEYNRNRAVTQEEIDKVLEKISKSGYGSLSKAEKDLLFKSSNKK
ncbi:MAG: rhomboid family intramembrane serine protease [Bacteroidales bacterium]|nr:rhomboid family intramembrane serine protease [Bacteroidales bacterium]